MHLTIPHVFSGERTNATEHVNCDREAASLGAIEAGSPGRWDRPDAVFLQRNQKTMSKSEPAEVSSIATGATSTSRSIDLDSVRPLGLPGGTVVLAQSHRETSHGAQISAGEVPVLLAGVCSPIELQRSLGALGFTNEQTERALRHPLKGERATRAVAIAEKRAGNAEVLA